MCWCKFVPPLVEHPTTTIRAHTNAQLYKIDIPLGKVSTVQIKIRVSFNLQSTCYAIYRPINGHNSIFKVSIKCRLKNKLVKYSARMNMVPILCRFIGQTCARVQINGLRRQPSKQHQRDISGGKTESFRSIDRPRNQHVYFFLGLWLPLQTLLLVTI